MCREQVELHQKRQGAVGLTPVDAASLQVVEVKRGEGGDPLADSHYSPTDSHAHSCPNAEISSLTFSLFTQRLLLTKAL